MLPRGSLVAALACAVSCVCAGTATAGIPAWTTYRHDGGRSGIDPDSGSPVAPTQAWQSQALDGQVYGQPLVYGQRVYVATENDTVYALDTSTGAVVWQRHLATPVDSTALPCGNISPTVGITSTPAIDPATGRIYVVADTWDGSNASSVQHQMYGLNLTDGSVGVGPVAVDPPGSTHTDQLQRAGLALDASKVIIGYGGNSGDCGNYHGWLVAAREDGAGSLQTYEVDSQPGDSGGAIWAAGNAPVIDSAGDIWIATGNGSSGTFDFSESVIKLDSNLNRLDWWAPSTWQTLDNNDNDLGSSMPVLLPGGLVFQIGKEGTGYLLNASNLGRTHTGPPAFRYVGVCGGSWGGGIYHNGVIYVACGNSGSDGTYALALDTANKSFTPLPGWSVTANAISPPIFAGGLVWSVDYNGNTLYGLDPTSGNPKFTANLTGFEHFGTASAGGGRLFVPNQDQTVSGVDQITAFQIAGTPAPSPTSVALSSSANPASVGQPVTFTAAITPGPDAGTVAFTDGGAPIAGCPTVTITPASNAAECTTTFSASGAHSINASYSGDRYYLASGGSLSETVQSSPSAVNLSNVRVRVVRRKLRLKFTVSQEAKLAVAIFKLEPGRIVLGRCWAGARHGRRCQALRHRGTLHLLVQAGQRRLRPHMRVLPPGRYAIMLTAVGSSGARSNSVTVIVVVRSPARPRATARIAAQMAMLALSLL